MQVYASGFSDVGCVREMNEDSFLIDEACQLFIVADGMGGHSGGQVASSLTVQSIHAYVLEHLNTLQEQASQPFVQSPTLTLLAQAVQQACTDVYAYAQQHPELDGMGTTVVVVFMCGQRAFLAHVGDSRIYLLRHGQLQQLTEDHSLVNEHIKMGLLRPEDAATSRIKNIITRSVGFEPRVDVDVQGLELINGDRLLLCSDGVSNLVSQDQLLQAMQFTSIQELPMTLVYMANDAGGDDNSTVVALEYQSHNENPTEYE